MSIKKPAESGQNQPLKIRKPDTPINDYSHVWDDMPLIQVIHIDIFHTLSKARFERHSYLICTDNRFSVVTVICGDANPETIL